MSYRDEIAHHNSFYTQESKLIFGSFIFNLFYRKLINRLKQEGLIFREARVLSLGCGDGHFESIIAPLVASVTGLDISSTAVDQANRKCKELGIENFRAICTNLVDFDPSNYQGKFDVILAVGLLHHIPEEQLPALLQQYLLFLKPGGRFASSDPSAMRLVNLFKRLFQRKYAATHTPDERELIPHEVKMLAKNSGFQNVEIEFYDFFMGPLSWVWPSCPSFIAICGHIFDQILVRIPVINRYSSAFLLLADRPR